MTSVKPIRVLATDMDGTFIPLSGNQDNAADLPLLCEQLDQRQLELVYVTGRHYQLVLDAIQTCHLPAPQWLICDVGTSIYRQSRSDSADHELVAAYQDHLAEIVGPFDVQRLANELSDFAALTLQEAAKQGRFKLSFYCPATAIERLTIRLQQRLTQLVAPYRIIASVDPFTGDGLIDFLPTDVSKHHALRWWVDHTGREKSSIVFAGDSGNDVAALTAGYRSIVVANADQAIVDQVSTAHRAAGWQDRLFIAGRPATSGVLQGLLHFLAQSSTLS